jgi:GNAT superfamily N-acetyltransferase
MEFTVTRLSDITADIFVSLVAKSEREGWHFLRRLKEDWATGSNRFDQPGEALFAAWVDDVLVGVCGLNSDPYTSIQSVGRVRRLYVLPEFRGRGIGRNLVQAVIQSAGDRFRSLRVRTESFAAGGLYEQLGFVSVFDVAECTHTLTLGSTTEPGR